MSMERVKPWIGRAAWGFFIVVLVLVATPYVISPLVHDIAFLVFKNAEGQGVISRSGALAFRAAPERFMMSVLESDELAPRHFLAASRIVSDGTVMPHQRSFLVERAVDAGLSGTQFIQLISDTHLDSRVDLLLKSTSSGGRYLEEMSALNDEVGVCLVDIFSNRFVAAAEDSGSPSRTAQGPQKPR